MKLELRHKSRYPWIQFNFRERRRSRPPTIDFLYWLAS